MFGQFREKSRRIWDQISLEEVRLFIGPNAESFRRAAHGAHAAAYGGKSAWFTWSWGAFVFSFAWFAYRKMYSAAVLSVAVPLACAIVFGLDLDNYIFVLAVMAKPMYVAHAAKRVFDLKARRDYREEMLISHGGVSMLAGAMAGVPWLLIMASFVWHVAVLPGR